MNKVNVTIFEGPNDAPMELTYKAEVRYILNTLTKIYGKLRCSVDDGALHWVSKDGVVILLYGDGVKETYGYRTRK